MTNKFKIDKDFWHSETTTVRSVENSELVIKVEKDIACISKLNSEWNKLVLSSEYGNIYLTHEWVCGWWNHFSGGTNLSLHVLMILNDEKLISIAPFYIQSFSFGGFEIYRKLKLIGSGIGSGISHSNAVEERGVSDFLDVIVLKGQEFLTAELISNYLYEFRSYFFNEFDFQNITEESFIFKNLLPLVSEKNFRMKITKSDICPRIKIRSFDGNYFSSVNTSTRRKYKKIQKSIECNPQIKVEEVNEQNFKSAFQVLKHLHQQRWNELGYLGLFSDKRFEKFIEDVHCRLNKNGWLWFKVFKLDNKIIAARIAYKFNNRLYDYISGFDHRQFAATLRPGIALVFAMINEAVNQNYDSVELLRGAEAYKLEIASEIKDNYRIVVYPENSLAKLSKSIFYLKEIKLKFAYRLKSEKEIIKLHINRSGKYLFIRTYLKFCFLRLIAVKTRREKKTKRLKKISIAENHKRKPLITNNSKSRMLPRIKQAGIQ